MSVGEELRNDARLRDDLAIINQRWDKSSGIDLKVLGGTWDTKINDLSLEFQAKFGEGNLSTVSPGAPVVGIKLDGWSHGES